MKDLESLLRMLIQKGALDIKGIGVNVDDDEDLKSKSEAKGVLEKFLTAKREFEVGDYVERNDYGKKRYKLPNGNMVAKCVKIFDEPYMDDEHTLCDALIACAMGKEKVLTFPVNSQFYKKAAAKDNIVPLWRKQKEDD